MRLMICSAMLIMAFASCTTKVQDKDAVLNTEMHTFSNYEQVTCKHLDWKAVVDFDDKQIRGQAIWTFENKSNAAHIHFDTYALGIKQIKVNGKAVTYTLGKFDPVYGSGLSIPIG